VTLIDLRQCLGLEPRSEEAPTMAIGVESDGESYGLLIESIGEVLKLDDGAREPNPINLDPRLAPMSAGIYRLEGQLLILLDVERVLDTGGKAVAA
jgi:purine-binding chemotaxis protein CheW